MTDETWRIIAGNAVSAVGMAVYCVSSLQKDKKRMLSYQIVNHGIFVVSGLILAGYSGVAQDVISMIRNAVLIKKKSSTILVPCLLVAAGIIAGVLSNNMGVIGLCPVVACAQYGAAAIYPRSSVNFLRVSMVINSSLWAVYCIVLKNYVNALANIVLAIVAVIAIIKSVCKKETEGRNE